MLLLFVSELERCLAQTLRQFESIKNVFITQFSLFLHAQNYALIQLTIVISFFFVTMFVLQSIYDDGGIAAFVFFIIRFVFVHMKRNLF